MPVLPARPHICLVRARAYGAVACVRARARGGKGGGGVCSCGVWLFTCERVGKDVGGRARRWVASCARMGVARREWRWECTYIRVLNFNLPARARLSARVYARVCARAALPAARCPSRRLGWSRRRRRRVWIQTPCLFTVRHARRLGVQRTAKTLGVVDMQSLICSHAVLICSRDTGTFTA